MFTETNPDKGTKTLYPDTRTRTMQSLQKLTPIRGRKHDDYDYYQEGANLVYRN